MSNERTSEGLPDSIDLQRMVDEIWGRLNQRGIRQDMNRLKYRNLLAVCMSPRGDDSAPIKYSLLKIAKLRLEELEDDIAYDGIGTRLRCNRCTQRQLLYQSQG